MKQVIKTRQLSTLLVNLILATYQKKLGGQLGIMPGTELLTAAQTAQRLDIPIALCDRDVRVTLRRAWLATSFWKKGYLLATLVTSLFDRTELDENKLSEMRSKDVLSELIKELGASLPQTKTVLIDERDIFMAEKIKETQGTRLVAVVGAGHVEGIQRVLGEDNRYRLGEISTVMPGGRLGKIIGWTIPSLIVLALLSIGLRHGAHELSANALYWILANGIPTSIGAALAFAHPPDHSLRLCRLPPHQPHAPDRRRLCLRLCTGYVLTAAVVKEFEQVSTALTSLKGWWQNKLLRIFLVFFMTTLGSALGTWVGGYKLFSSLTQ